MTSPQKENWRDDFDRVFLATMYNDDGYSEERAVLKEFIEDLLSKQREEVVRESINAVSLMQGYALRETAGLIDMDGHPPRKGLENHIFVSAMEAISALEALL